MTSEPLSPTPPSPRHSPPPAAAGSSPPAVGTDVCGVAPTLHASRDGYQVTSAARMRASSARNWSQGNSAWPG